MPTGIKKKIKGVCFKFLPLNEIMSVTVSASKLCYFLFIKSFICLFDHAGQELNLGRYDRMIQMRQKV